MSELSATGRWAFVAVGVGEAIGSWIGFVVGAAILAITWGVFRLTDIRRQDRWEATLSEEEKQRLALARRPVKVVKSRGFSGFGKAFVTFEFANPEFGRAFADVNPPLK